MTDSGGYGDSQGAARWVSDASTARRSARQRRVEVCDVLQGQSVPRGYYTRPQKHVADIVLGVVSVLILPEHSRKTGQKTAPIRTRLYQRVSCHRSAWEGARMDADCMSFLPCIRARPPGHGAGTRSASCRTRVLSRQSPLSRYRSGGQTCL